MKLLRLRNVFEHAVHVSNEESDFQKAAEQLSLFKTWVSDVLSIFHLIVFICILGYTGT